MTRDQIKAELRRSACEDEQISLSAATMEALAELLTWREITGRGFPNRKWRTFFLLVAEAL